MRGELLAMACALTLLGPGPAACLAASGPSGHGTTAVLLGDGFAAGQDVVIEREGLQDVFAAGELVRISASTGGNVHLAGRRLEVRAPVGGSLYALGQSVSIEASIAGRLYAGAEVVTIASSATVDGGARVGARRITLDGTVRHGAALAGHRVELNGTIDGDGEVMAQELVISPGARITGTFTYRAPEEMEIPVTFADASRVTYVPIEDHDADVDPASPAPWLIGRVGSLLLAILVGALLLAIVPRFSERVALAARTHPWPAMGWGCVGLILLFACIGLMVLSLLGIPLAVVLALATPPVLFVAYVLGAFALGTLVAQRLGRRIPSGWAGRLGLLAAGLVALALVGLLPVLGWLAGVATVLLGIGAAIMLWRAARPGEPA